MIPVIKMNAGETRDMIELCSSDVQRNSGLYERRRSILPCYPAADKRDKGHLLLPNLSRMYRARESVLQCHQCATLADQLTHDELVRRQSGTFMSVVSVVDHDLTRPSFLREKYHMLYGDLIERLKVDLALLDYNYTRLNSYLRMFTDEQIRVFNLRSWELRMIDEKEYPVALEFFLQFDGRRQTSDTRSL